MYDGATTTVRSAARLTKEFEVGVRLHQGSALSPFLFAIIIDRLTEDIRKDAPWDMLFADDIVLSRQNHGELEEDLDIWRNALERRSLKVSRSKTEYLMVGGVDDGEELKLQGEKVKRAKNFKYLGSTVSSDGRCSVSVQFSFISAPPHEQNNKMLRSLCVIKDGVRKRKKQQNELRL